MTELNIEEINLVNGACQVDPCPDMFPFPFPFPGPIFVPGSGEF